MKRHSILLLIPLLILLILLNYFSLVPNTNLGKTQQQLFIESNQRTQLAQINKDYKYWQEELPKRGQFRDIYLILGQLAWQMENPSLALKFLDESKKLDPNHQLTKTLEKIMRTNL